MLQKALAVHKDMPAHSHCETSTQLCCLCEPPCAGPAAQQLELLQTAEQLLGFDTWRLLRCTAELPVSAA